MDVKSLPVPELTTFGALIRHGLALEGLAAAIYREQGDKGAALAAKHEARQALLERTRREKLSEIILEPIEGLNGEDYVPAAPGDIETVSARFYRDSSKTARMMLAEVSKIFDRMAAENDRFHQDAQ